MRKSFSSAQELIHVFAQQKQSSGKCSNMFFENTVTLYDYGYHYPLALYATNKKGEKAMIINTQGYSVTTSKHIGMVKYATNQHNQFMLPNTDAMKQLLGNYDARITEGLSVAIIHCIGSFYDKLEYDKKKRKQATLDKWKEDTMLECENYVNILDWYGFKPSKEAIKAMRQLTGLPAAEAKAAAIKAKALREKKRAKAALAEHKKHAALMQHCVKAWLANEVFFVSDDGAQHNTLHWIARNETVLLRINGEDVETSKGAKFPLEHGLKALPLINQAIGKGWHKNGHTIHLGHYQIDEILAAGDVKAGCHFVLYSEVMRIAKELGQ